MAFFLAFITPIIIITLIFTLNKRSKIRKFLIIFTIILSLISLTVYLYSLIQSAKYEKKITEQKELQIKEEEKLQKEKPNIIKELELKTSFLHLDQSPLTISKSNPIMTTARITNHSKKDLTNIVIGYMLADCNEKCITVAQNTLLSKNVIPSEQARDMKFDIVENKDVIIYGKLQIHIGIIDFNLNDKEQSKFKYNEIIN